MLERWQWHGECGRASPVPAKKSQLLPTPPTCKTVCLSKGVSQILHLVIQPACIGTDELSALLVTFNKPSNSRRVWTTLINQGKVKNFK